MSKKQNMKGKRFIPAEMNGKVFQSLADLGSALGCKATESPTLKGKNCRKCGHPMRQVPGTNVWVCGGVVEQEKDGVKTMVPCKNRAMTSVDPRPQSSENPGNFKPKKQSKPAPVQAATA